MSNRPPRRLWRRRSAANVINPNTINASQTGSSSAATATNSSSTHQPTLRIPRVTRKEWPCSEFMLGAGMVIIQPSSGKVVLVYEQRKKYWFLPKGRKDVGESLEEAVLREAYEEVSLASVFDDSLSLTLLFAHPRADCVNRTTSQDTVYSSFRYSCTTTLLRLPVCLPNCSAQSHSTCHLYHGPSATLQRTRTYTATTSYSGTSDR